MLRDKPLVPVRAVMKTKFDVVDAMATVATALETMRHVENKTLIVKRRHEGDEIGMVLISDIARHVLATDRAPDRVNVYEIMAKPVITVSPEMDIRYCARLFTRFELTRAPVVENGEVVGIVSMTDLVLKGMVPYL
jgi:CBS domain-containing protein